MKTIGKKYTVTFFGPDGEEYVDTNIYQDKYSMFEIENEIIPEQYEFFGNSIFVNYIGKVDAEEEFKYGFKEFEKEIISEELYREIKEREDRELSPDLVKHLLS